MHSGWSETSRQASLQTISNSHQTGSGAGSFSSDQLSAVTYQQNNPQPTQAELLQPATVRPDLLAKEARIKFSVHLHPRPANNVYDDISFGQQHQAQHPWLPSGYECLSKLAKTSTHDDLQQETLQVPWVWIARDLMQLLPVSSCYSYFMEDDDLYCQFVQQLTAEDVNVLSAPGARLMAEIVCELSQQAPKVLAEYVEASPAVLQRIKEICTALCSVQKRSDAAAYAVEVAGCLLVYHENDMHSCTKRTAIKKSLHMLLLLPADLQSSACTKLLQSHQTFQALFLRLGDAPAPLGQCMISLAVEHLERQVRITKRLSQKDANNICDWRIWVAAPNYLEGSLLQMIELAVYANQLLHQMHTTRLNVRAVGIVQQYVELVGQASQPDKLDMVLAGAQDDPTAQAVQLVIWTALLYSRAQESTHCSKHDMYMYLKRVSDYTQADAVSKQHMIQALCKLNPNVDRHSNRAVPHSREPPAATLKPSEPASNSALPPAGAAIVQGVAVFSLNSNYAL